MEELRCGLILLVAVAESPVFDRKGTRSFVGARSRRPSESEMLPVDGPIPEFRDAIAVQALVSESFGTVPRLVWPAAQQAVAAAGREGDAALVPLARSWPTRPRVAQGRAQVPGEVRRPSVRVGLTGSQSQSSSVTRRSQGSTPIVLTVQPAYVGVDAANVALQNRSDTARHHVFAVTGAGGIRAGELKSGTTGRMVVHH